MANVAITSLKEAHIGPGIKLLTGTLKCDSAHASTLGDTADLSAYTPKIHQAVVVPKVNVKWFNVLTANFASGKFNISAITAGAATAPVAVASGTDLSSVSADFLVLCSHGLGDDLVTLV